MFASISKLFRKSARGADQSPSGQAGGAVGPESDAAAAPESGPSIALPFSILLKAVPHNLHGKNASAQNPTGNFFMSRSEVLEQLAKGALRIPFGAIRSGAPNGFFTTSASQDETLIDIPLKDVVGQLRQEDLTRHPRARVEVPTDVTDLFGCKGAGLRVMAKQEVSKMVSDTAMRRKAEAAAAAPVAATPAAPVAAATAVAAAPIPAAPIALSANLAASLNEAQATARPAARTTAPATPPVAAPAIPSIRPAAVPPVASTLPPANVVPGVTSPARPRIEGSALVVPLSQLCDTWSEAIREEIRNLKLTGSHCHLPLAELGKGVKQGKIELPWKTVRTWLKPLPSGPSTHGETIVSLPLQVIAPMFVSQQKAATPQKADVPQNVPDVFSRAGAAAAPAPPPPPPPVAPPPAPPVRMAAPPPPPPPAPIPVAAPAPVPAPPRTPPPAPAPAPARTPAPAPAPAAPRAAAPAPAATRKRESNTERRESNTERRRKIERTESTSTSSTVSISVSLLAANWPATLVKDIDPKFLTKAKLEIPVQALEAGVRAGKVDFSWSELCGWMQPAAAEELVAAHAETRLGLPLSVVAPLFLQRKPAPQPKKESTLAGDIPDVFDQSGAIIAPPVSESPIIEAPAPPPVPPAPPAPAPAAPAAPRGGTEFMERPKRPMPAKPGAVKDLAELFGQPDKRNWTPNEIVKHTAKLPGVAGALIALQDGLLVASCMPPQWKTETVAAFLPQIFGRMHQYTKELKMGELFSVTMTVEAGALQIFASGIIYFATLSTPDMQLPIHELNVIAHELSRHTK